MQLELLHPADQLLIMMNRIYSYGMTTTSGGNLSIKEENGDIWITPAGVDKGSLTRSDMICVKPDGTVIGKHRPSSELPFHQTVYRKRPDLKAVVHAHPPALVAFSIVRKVPNTALIPNDNQIIGKVGMADYALPGSSLLGDNVASKFEEGFNAVMLENHGVVVGGIHLFEAFKLFETLEYCARLEINAKRIGTPRGLTAEQLAIVKHNQPLEEFVPNGYSAEEKEARREMCELIHRSYNQRLFTSTQGTFSRKLDDNSFIITPYNKDRKYLDINDLVRIENGKAEKGKIPSRSVALHQHIYAAQPHVNSIILAQPPHIMAYAVTDAVFDSRTIPESYILLRYTPKIPFGATYSNLEKVVNIFTKEHPVVIAENDCVIVTGQSLLNAFDRLEVAEYSAQAIIQSTAIGDVVHIDDRHIKDIDVAFNLI